MNTVEIEKRTLNHPCFTCKAYKNARIHLPVAPKCNIQCNYCVRKFDCINESRPGVVSSILTPAEAVERYIAAKKALPNITVAGIAGPGDALANFPQVRETLKLLRKVDPDVTFCMSTNGLMLPFYANELIALGVSHLTVTVNTVDVKTGAKIYDHINYLGKTYRGEEGAAILLHNQLSGIRYLTSKGMVIKINTVLLKGINADKIKDVVAVAKESGCKIENIMQLIPVKGSAFEYMEVVSNADLNRIRKKCESVMPQMYHCKQCRADAIGTLDNDISYKYSQHDKKMKETAGAPIGKYRFAVCSSDGELINQHFGHSTEFFIYDYEDGKQTLIESRPVYRCSTELDQYDEGERIEQMVKTIDDCDALLCMRVGGKPMELLNQNGIQVFAAYERIDNAVRNGAKQLSRGVMERVTMRHD